MENRLSVFGYHYLLGELLVFKKTNTNSHVPNPDGHSFRSLNRSIFSKTSIVPTLFTPSDTYSLRVVQILELFLYLLVSSLFLVSSSRSNRRPLRLSFLRLRTFCVYPFLLIVHSLFTGSPGPSFLVLVWVTGLSSKLIFYTSFLFSGTIVHNTRTDTMRQT